MVRKNKNLFKLGTVLLILMFLSACSKNTASTEKSSNQARPSSDQTRISSSSAASISHSSTPNSEDLTYTIWYDKGENNYLVFDGTTMTRRMAHPAQDAIGRPSSKSYPYSINGNVISFNYGMTGVDDEFVMSWLGNKIKLTPNDNQPNKEERSKILISIDDLIHDKDF